MDMFQSALRAPTAAEFAHFHRGMSHPKKRKSHGDKIQHESEVISHPPGLSDLHPSRSSGIVTYHLIGII